MNVGSRWDDDRDYIYDFLKQQRILLTLGSDTNEKPVSFSMLPKKEIEKIAGIAAKILENTQKHNPQFAAANHHPEALALITPFAPKNLHSVEARNFHPAP